MLIYHPAYDINHCLYRMLLIIESSIHEEFNWDLFRLMDFYMLFPHVMKEISPFPISLRSFKKIIHAIPDSYENMPNTKRILFDLESIQNAAILNLIAKDLLNVDLFRKKIVKRTKIHIPETLKSTIDSDVIIGQEWFRFIVNELPLVDFFGNNGLKSRNKLMEFRYDG